MVVDIPARQIPFYIFELTTVLAGLVIWFVFQFGSRTTQWRIARVTHWSIETSAFLIVCLQVLFGSVVGAIVMRIISGALPDTIQSDAIFMVMLTNMGLHLGAVVAALWSTHERYALGDIAENAPRNHASEVFATKAITTSQTIVAGILTFAAAVAVIAVVSLVWQALLSGLGIPAEKQELINMFGKTRDPIKLGIMSFTAVVVAPVAEEFAFRAGLFRFLRSRISRSLAFVLPAAVFALLHTNVGVFAPLFALGLVFSLAYERTGKILVSVIAHALFNLNTIVLVLLNLNI